MKSQAEIIAQKNELYSLIKKYGLHHGEDIDFLREYAKEVYAKNDLDKALACFRSLNEQIKYDYKN